MIAILHRGKMAAAAMLALASLAFTQIGTATPAAAQDTVEPQSGYWSNPDQPGRGFSIEIKDNKLFMGMMYYDTDNTSKWTVSSGPMTDATHYKGKMLEYKNGQALHGTFVMHDAYTVVGEVELEFTSATTANLTWPEGTVAINRMAIVPAGFSTTPLPNMPQTGWYWQPAEGGRGWFVEVQGDTAYVTAYCYDDDGQSGWYVSRGQMVTSAFYMGKFTAFTGGSPLGATYSSPTNIVDGGYVTMRFPVEEQDGTAALWLGGGEVIPLIRYDFSGFAEQEAAAAAAE